MDLNHQKELFSTSLAMTIASQSGCSWELSQYDDRVDIVLTGQKWKTKPKIEIQMKSTADFSCYSSCGEYIDYDLRAKNFNDLCGTYFTPFILVLAIVPSTPSLWAKQSSKNLTMQYGLYYYNLNGQDFTENKTSKKIKIPINQEFNRNNLSKMMSIIDDTGELNDGK